MLTSLLPCGSPASDTVEGKFVADMRVAPRGTVGYALDVGANSGAWSWQCVEMGSAGKVIKCTASSHKALLSTA